MKTMFLILFLFNTLGRQHHDAKKKEGKDRPMLVAFHRGIGIPATMIKRFSLFHIFRPLGDPPVGDVINN